MRAWGVARSRGASTCLLHIRVHVHAWLRHVLPFVHVCICRGCICKCLEGANTCLPSRFKPSFLVSELHHTAYIARIGLISATCTCAGSSCRAACGNKYRQSENGSKKETCTWSFLCVLVRRLLDTFRNDVGEFILLIGLQFFNDLGDLQCCRVNVFRSCAPFCFRYILSHPPAAIFQQFNSFELPAPYFLKPFAAMASTESGEAAQA